LNKQENHTICNARADIATFTGRTIVLKDGHIIQDYINTNVQSAARSTLALPVEED
jgi:putative ABC transport system ATP-binding protein